MSERILSASKTLMFTGVLLVFFGLIVVFSPIATSQLVVTVVAMLLCVTGVLRLVQAFKSQARLEMIGSSLLGAVIIGLGVLVWLNPDVGSGFLTVLLSVFFLAHGVWKLITAFHYRRFAAWGWLLISGLVSLFFAYLMLKQWPLSGAWSIGILVGADLIFTGVVSILLSRSMKRARGTGSMDTISF